MKILKHKIGIAITLISKTGQTLADSFQLRYVEILLPLARDILIIGGTTTISNDRKVHSIEAHHWRGSKYLFFKILDVVWFQFSACYKLFIQRKSWDAVLLSSFGEFELLPVILAKLFNKKAIIIQGGSYEKSLYFNYKNSWKGIGIILPACASILARITRTFADGIVVDTARATTWLGLTHYQKKIYVCGMTHIDVNVFTNQRPLNRRVSIGQEVVELKKKYYDTGKEPAPEAKTNKVKWQDEGLFGSGLMVSY